MLEPDSHSYDIELIILQIGHYDYVYLDNVHLIVVIMTNRMNSVTPIALRSISE